MRIPISYTVVYLYAAMKRRKNKIGVISVSDAQFRVSEPACFGAAPAPGKREHNFGIF